MREEALPDTLPRYKSGLTAPHSKWWGVCVTRGGTAPNVILSLTWPIPMNDATTTDMKVRFTVEGLHYVALFQVDGSEAYLKSIETPSLMPFEDGQWGPLAEGAWGAYWAFERGEPCPNYREHGLICVGKKGHFENCHD